MTCSGERGNARPGPNQSEGSRHLDFLFVANTYGMNMALDHGSHFTLFHARLDVVASVLHADCRELVGEPHALELLSRLDHAQFGKKRRSVCHFLASRAECIIKALPINGWLTHHAIADLRILRELDAHAAVPFSFAHD